MIGKSGSIGNMGMKRFRKNTVPALSFKLKKKNVYTKLYFIGFALSNSKATRLAI